MRTRSKTRGKTKIDQEVDVCRVRHIVALELGDEIKISCNTSSRMLAWSSTLDNDYVEACIERVIQEVSAPEEVHVQKVNDKSRGKYYQLHVAIFLVARDRTSIIEPIAARLSGKVGPGIRGIERNSVHVSGTALQFWQHIPSTRDGERVSDIVRSLLMEA